MSTEHKHAKRRTVGEWLSEPFEWRIPVYQRHYAWNPEEEYGPTYLFWEIVEEQALVRLKGKTVDPHYFGAILVENKSGNLESTQKYDVVDGQQRLTTISVALFALVGVASQLNFRAEIQNKLAKYIFTDPEPGARSQPNLLPTNFDEMQFQNLRSAAFDAFATYRDDNEQARKSKVVQACDFFADKFADFIKNNSPSDDLAGLNSLIDSIIDGFELILIALKKTDKAQKVFESINNTARPLTTFDLIRNNIFDRAGPSIDIELFRSEAWQQFEHTFWEDAPGRSDKNTHVEAYIARMLMAKEKRLISSSRDPLFREYKKFAQKEKESGFDVRSEINTISEYVDIYKYLVGENRKNPLGNEFDFGYFMHKICKSMDFYPTIFTITNSNAELEEKQRMISLLESYVIRRHICQLPSGDYNKRAPEMCKALGNKPSAEKLDEYLKGSDSPTRVFSNNAAVLNACLNNDFYNKCKLKAYIFDNIIKHTARANFDERLDTRGLTIDHIMPQRWHEREGWAEALQNNSIPEEIDRKIHTIGNLTPMSSGRNSAKSNLDWSSAQKYLDTCGLNLTRDLAKNQKWGLEEINARSEKLAKIICEIWLEYY